MARTDDGNPVLMFTVELDPAEYNAADLTYHKGRAKRLLEDAFPGAAVNARAGQLRWWESNDGWSTAA